MSGYYPGIDRPPRRRGDERREPYPRRADRGREDIPWRGGRREDERDRARYDRDRDARYRSRSRDRQTDTRYARYSRDSSRDRRPSPVGSRFREEGQGPASARRRSRSRDSTYRREDEGRYASNRDRERDRRGPGSRATSRPRTPSSSQRGATAEPLDYSSEEGMVSPPPRRAPLTAEPRSPARRDRQSSRSSSPSDRPRFTEKRPVHAGDLSPHKRPRLSDSVARDNARSPPRPTDPPSGPAASHTAVNPYAARLPPRGHAASPSSKPFAPPSAPRSERFGTERFGVREPPRGPAAERYGAPRPDDASRRGVVAIPSVAEPRAPQDIPARDPQGSNQAAQTPGRLEPPPPAMNAADRIARPATPASSHRSPGTPASGVDSLDRRPVAAIPAPAKSPAHLHGTGERSQDAAPAPSTGGNPYASTPARPPLPSAPPASANRRPEKLPYDREWKRYKSPAEPMVLDRTKLDGVLKEQAIDEDKTKFVTVRSRDISKYSEWEGELAKANYERAKKVHAFQTLAHEARLARYDLERAEDEILAAEKRIEYARAYQAHSLDFESLSEQVRQSPKRVAAT